LAPDPGNLLFELADAPDALLRLIHECLANTDDSSPNPQDRQQAFVATRMVEGLRQDGFPGTVEPAEAIIPVVDTTILAASTDNYASLALGYGTYDFPPGIQDDPDEEGGYDYMVVNTYLVRPFEEGVFPFDFSYKAEFAALSESRPRPDRPGLLSVTGKNHNRPLSRDATTDESVELQFLAPAFPQAYGVVKADSAGHITILNEERRFNPESYDPHIPDIPHSENVPGATCTFTDPFSPIPLGGSEDYGYFLAAVDLFGRWSAYDQRSYVANALPPQRPGLIAARLREVRPLPATNPPDLPCEVEIDFSWDWTERSPEKIQIGGGFYPYGSLRPPFQQRCCAADRDQFFRFWRAPGQRRWPLGGGDHPQRSRCRSEHTPLQTDRLECDGRLSRTPGQSGHSAGYGSLARGLQRHRPGPGTCSRWQPARDVV